MRLLVLASVASIWAHVAVAQRMDPPTVQAAQDHSIVYEFGAAGDWSRVEGAHPGATFAVEITAIEHWLELEFGVTGIRANTATEWSFDALAKKPWRISPSFEFMMGAGPEILRADGATFWGTNTVLDFMFWPRANVGWYIEPGWEATFRDVATHHGLAVAVGLLIGR